jgi:hypothetical protein
MLNDYSCEARHIVDEVRRLVNEVQFGVRFDMIPWTADILLRR